MYHVSALSIFPAVTTTVQHHRPAILTVLSMALLLVLCQFGSLHAAPVPESLVLNLAWDTPAESVHHYVLEITKTDGDDMADPHTTFSYTDDTAYDLMVEDGFTYAIRILSVDEYGNRSARSEESLFTVEDAMIIEKTAFADNDVPGVFSLHQNHPNPFNPATTITYDLPLDGHVNLTVYNVTGQKIAVLHNGHMPAGSHAIRWDAHNMPSGTYFYTITTNKHRTSRKMLLLK